MKKNNVYILEDRGLLYINGEDVKEFLQNIITNNIDIVSENNSCFAGLLSPQGKYLYDFLVIKHKSGYFLDCEKKIIDDLYKQLNLYKIRSKVEILNLSNEFVVAALHKKKFLEIEGSKDQLGYTIKYREDNVFLDPRNTKLGARLIINLEKLYLSLKKLNLKTSNVEEYYNLSHDLGIPQIDTKNLQNKLFGIECNFEELNGIDFKKGCYVGQENTARIKHKDKLNKRILPLTLLEGNLEHEVLKINNNEIGKVLIKNKNPFALVKFKEKEFEFNKELKCENAKVLFKKPQWLDFT
jgi:hypothetical protein